MLHSEFTATKNQSPERHRRGRDQTLDAAVAPARGHSPEGGSHLEPTGAIRGGASGHLKTRGVSGPDLGRFVRYLETSVRIWSYFFIYLWFHHFVGFRKFFRSRCL